MHPHLNTGVRLCFSLEKDCSIHYIFCQDKMQVDQEEGGHQKCHAEHTPEEEIDHTGAKTKVCFPAL